MPGFTTVTRENVIVSVGQNTQIDMQLKLSSVQETVTVTSETPLLDPRKVETGQNFSRDELTEIPTSRDIWSLIQQVPGVQIDTVNVAGNQSAIAGGPDFITKGSGNVVYQVDGATSTDNTYGNPFARQNGGTNTFFDFSTFQDVEVATGGSVLEQQTSGVTINVVTKRGTNEFHGAARYLYASSNWQSDNTPQEAVDQGLPTNNTRMIREYGADFGGPIVKDKLWLWFAGAYQTINTNQTAFSTTFGTFASPTWVNLEPWSAKLNGRSPARTRRSSTSSAATGRRPTRAPGRLARPRRRPCHDPDQLLQGRGLARLLRRTSSPRSSRPTRARLHRPRQRLQELRADRLHRRLRAGRHDRDAWITRARLQQLPLLQRQGPAEAGQRHDLQVLQHRHGQPRGEVQLQLPAADRGLGDGLARRSELRGEYEYSSSNTALLSRGVRPIYKNAVLERHARRHDHDGQPDDQRSAFATTSSRPRTCPATGFENVMFPDLLPTLQYHGADGWQFDYTNWQPRVSATYALGEKKNDAPARPRTRSLPTSSASSFTT